MKDLIADFGKQHGVCKQVITDYVIGFLDENLQSSDPGDPYCFTEDEESDDNKDGVDENDDDNEEDEIDEEDEEDCSSGEDGMAWRRRAWTTSDVRV